MQTFTSSNAADDYLNNHSNVSWQERFRILSDACHGAKSTIPSDRDGFCLEISAKYGSHDEAAITYTFNYVAVSQKPAPAVMAVRKPRVRTRGGQVVTRGNTDSQSAITAS